MGDSIFDWWNNLWHNNETTIDNNDYTNNYYFEKKEAGYQPKRRGVRVKGKSKKDAFEKAKSRGNGKTPILHKVKGNIPRHYHPNVPDGHPFKHDHYFFSILAFFFGLSFDDNE